MLVVLTEPCFTSELLEEICAIDPDPGELVEFQGYSPQLFGMGGDLTHMLACHDRDDYDALERYARLCCRAVRHLLELPAPTIAYIHGEVMGGALEGVLACTRVFASGPVRMSLPEYAFGMWPGMGWRVLKKRLPDLSGPLEAGDVVDAIHLAVRDERPLVSAQALEKHCIADWCPAMWATMSEDRHIGRIRIGARAQRQARRYGR